jgi:hypothetical protein
MKFKPRLELTGKKFDRLLVVSRDKDHITHDGRATTKWICQCDCGKTVSVFTQDLTQKHTRSCGCLKREVNAVMMRKVSLRHGHAAPGRRHPTYVSWQAMKNRCYRPRDKEYARYGGAGIAICDWWLTYENFLQDMGERPTGTSLDRINPYGHYVPSNCRWATPLEQRHNRRHP